MTAQQKDDNKGSDNKVALYNTINEIKPEDWGSFLDPDFVSPCLLNTCCLFSNVQHIIS